MDARLAAWLPPRVALRCSHALRTCAGKQLGTPAVALRLRVRGALTPTAAGAEAPLWDPSGLCIPVGDCSLHGVGSGLAPRRVSAPPWLLPGPLEVADEHVLRGRRAGALGDGVGNHHVTSTDTGPGSRKGRPASCLAWLPVAG